MVSLYVLVKLGTIWGGERARERFDIMCVTTGGGII